MDAYLGSIYAFAFNYAPQNTPGAWLPCNGQALSIQQYQPLFALLGTRYGGDGVNNFCLPDLRGRVPIGTGQGTDLSNYTLGQKGGNYSNQLTPAQLPAHTHQATTSPFNVGTGNGQTSPVNNYFGTAVAGQPYNTAKSQTAGVDDTTGISIGISGVTGSGVQPVPTQPPYLTLNYCICVLGTWPPNPNG